MYGEQNRFHSTTNSVNQRLNSSGHQLNHRLANTQIHRYTDVCVHGDNRQTDRQKEEYLYSAILANTLKALRHGSEITPCLSLLRQHSPDGATPTEVADI